MLVHEWIFLSRWMDQCRSGNQCTITEAGASCLEAVAILSVPGLVFKTVPGMHSHPRVTYLSQMHAPAQTLDIQITPEFFWLHYLCLFDEVVRIEEVTAALKSKMIKRVNPLSDAEPLNIVF